MAINSKIEWTGNTWNPITGCTKVSEGCQNCYAERMANRLKLMGNKKYANGFRLTLHEGSLLEPLNWKKPSMIFVNSMSDLFHKDVPTDYIKQVFDTMNRADQHVFQVLTKRPERFIDINDSVEWTKNIWLGVTVENSKHANRVELLQNTDAQTTFISYEPLLDSVGAVNMSGIDWAIVGGESGPKSRPIQSEWIAEIKEQCERQEVLFYFKQWGGFNKKKSGREFQGRTWDAMPEFSV